MKTDPTAGIAGIAGTPLSHQAIESGNRTASQIDLKTKHSTAISDTVETSDRDADGRLHEGLPKTDPTRGEPADLPDLENGDCLDLTA